MKSYRFLSIIILLATLNSQFLLAQSPQVGKEIKMMTGKNEPVGEAKGLFPGRVVWSHNPGAAIWDGTTGFWFEDQWNPQQKVDDLLITSITSLTGKKDEKQAWNTLFTYFNQTKKRGDRGYKKGEKIAIKINMNNTSSHSNSNEINASPQLTYTLIRSLVNTAGVAQEDIIVFDASRFITDFLFDKCHKDFPGVVFIDNEGGSGRTKATYVEDAIKYSVDNGNLVRGLAECVVKSDYLINVALLKGHVGQGVTLCAKNWYGATSINRDWRKNSHSNFDPDKEGKPRYMTFTDLLGHKDLGEKTMLYLIDGLYGAKLVNGIPKPQWQSVPFHNSWPCSLFASQDGVAIDAVGLDFLCAEWPDLKDINYADQYLIEAALISSPPSKTKYDPEGDGTILSGSLGALEHWNNAASKQYSCNMGKNAGIELIQKFIGTK